MAIYTNLRQNHQSWFQSVVKFLLGMEAAKETTPCTPPKDGPVGPDGKKLKPCCACPETKRPRDECIMEKVGVSY